MLSNLFFFHINICEFSTTTDKIEWNAERRLMADEMTMDIPIHQLFILLQTLAIHQFKHY